MAVNTTPVYAGLAVGNMTEVLAASSTAEIDLLLVNTSADIRIDSLTIACDDTAVNLFDLYLSDGTDDKFITNIPVAITAGNTALGATPPCNVLGHTNMAGLAQTDTAGNKFFVIPKSCILRGKFHAALTAGKTAWIQIRGWKFADA